MCNTSAEKTKKKFSKISLKDSFKGREGGVSSKTATFSANKWQIFCKVWFSINFKPPCSTFTDCVADVVLQCTMVRMLSHVAQWLLLCETWHQHYHIHATHVMCPCTFSSTSPTTNMPGQIPQRPTCTTSATVSPCTFALILTSHWPSDFSIAGLLSAQCTTTRCYSLWLHAKQRKAQLDRLQNSQSHACCKPPRYKYYLHNSKHYN